VRTQRDLRHEDVRHQHPHDGGDRFSALIRTTHAAANPRSMLLSNARSITIQGQRQRAHHCRQHFQRTDGERPQQRHGADPGAPEQLSASG
jgi:hypothetical protein